jgi:hypothetical protein
MALPGLSFEVVRAAGIPLGIRSDQTAIIALTERGPVETPTLVRGMAEFTQRFGAALPGTLGALAAQGYFDNGGEQLIVARFIDPCAATSAATMLQAVGVTQTLSPPFTVPLVTSGPGGFGNDVQVEITLSLRKRAKGALQPAAGSPFQITGLQPAVLTSDACAPARVIAGAPAAVQWGKVTAVGGAGTTITFVPGVPSGPPGPSFPPPFPANAIVEIYDPTFSLTIREPSREDVVVAGLDLRHLDDARDRLAGTSVTIPPALPAVPSSSNAPASATDVELPLAGVLALSGGADGLDFVPNDVSGIAELAKSFQACIQALELANQPDTLSDVVIAPDLWSAIWETKGTPSRAFDCATAIGLADQMVQSAWRTSDRVVILDPPLTKDPRPFSTSELLRWHDERAVHLGPGAASGDLAGLTSVGTDFAAAFTPWVRIVAGGTYRGDDTMLVPPSAYVAGRMARTSRERGPWVATGNVSLEDVIGLDERLPIQEQEALQAVGISPLRVELPVGATIQGVRSLSWPDRPAWGYLSTRRLFNFLRRALTPLGLSYVFEPNTLATWLALRRDLTRLLRDVFLRGGLAGAKPSEGFYVRIDDTINPPDAVDAGIMTAEIGVAPAVPLEFLVVRLMVRQNTATVTEASP